MEADACYQLGHVIKTHGLKGEVSILLDVDSPQNYKELESVFIEINRKLVPFFIDSIKIKKDIAIVRFEDVTTIEDTNPILGQKIYLPIDLLPPSQGNHFYFHEIINYRIQDKKLGVLGKVAAVYTHPSQDLIAMIYKDTEILIPISEEIVKSLDRKQKVLHVDLPDGLLNVYLD